MISATLVFGSTFLTVFALGLQSLNVNQGHYVPAALTSAAISSGHLWLYRVMPNPTWWDLGGYYVGGVVGITASMWFHRRVRAWWQARRARRERMIYIENDSADLDFRTAGRGGCTSDEHTDVGLCGLHCAKRDDTH